MIKSAQNTRSVAQESILIQISEKFNNCVRFHGANRWSSALKKWVVPSSLEKRRLRLTLTSRKLGLSPVLHLLTTLWLFHPYLLQWRWWKEGPKCWLQREALYWPQFLFLLTRLLLLSFSTTSKTTLCEKLQAPYSSFSWVSGKPSV